MPSLGFSGLKGIFYARGVKVNVLFFDRRPGAKDPWTKTVYVE